MRIWRLDPELGLAPLDRIPQVRAGRVAWPYLLKFLWVALSGHGGRRVG